MSVPPWDIGLTGKLEYEVRVQALYDLSQAMEIECIKTECYLKLAVSDPPWDIGFCRPHAFFLKKGKGILLSPLFVRYAIF